MTFDTWQVGGGEPSLKIFCNTTLYLLDLIGFWNTLGIFHYAKLPSYKRVRWDRVAGFSHNRNNKLHILPHRQTFLCEADFCKSFLDNESKTLKETYQSSITVVVLCGLGIHPPPLKHSLVVLSCWHIHELPFVNVYWKKPASKSNQHEIWVWKKSFDMLHRAYIPP